jgi:hypothetical protein
MKTSFFTFLMVIFVASTILQGCFVPVNSLYESSKTLGKGNGELLGSYTNYSGEGDQLSSNFGFRAGIGLSEKTDLKIRYENMNTSVEVWDDEELFSTGHFISLIPKFGFKNPHMALLSPLSLYMLSSGEGSSKENNSIFSVSPTFLYTFFPNPNKIDITGGIRSEIFIADGTAFTFGLMAGAGFSSDLSKWAIRPEIGFMGGIFNIGLGVQFFLNKKRD